ncbi:MAG: transposase [Hyphomicrobiales bacterium]|nr:transposase [Hyphomicrobiales bacterium]MCP4999989.1 transposase [Hyphomicrobiales bacterium]
MTKPKRYKRFSSEFKREVIMRASEEGMTDKAVCDELGVSVPVLRTPCTQAIRIASSPAIFVLAASN